METRELICIGCPLGCPLTVRIDGEKVEVSGNTCKRGEDYAHKEVLSPTRIDELMQSDNGEMVKRCVADVVGKVIGMKTSPSKARAGYPTAI